MAGKSFVLRGAVRDYLLDCTSQDALVRIEEQTGFTLYECVEQIARKQPPDRDLMRGLMQAMCLDDLTTEEFDGVVEDIGPDVILKAVHMLMES